jgi:hypothetical protein
MVGAGEFKHLINTNNRHLAAAVDSIPLLSEISESDYQRFVDNVRKAYVKASRAPGLATVTRLLAVKRPDYFICTDDKNRRRLSEDFGFAPNSLSLDNYWERVVETIKICAWWNAPRPKGTDAAIWDSRAAMLDAIYYEGPGPTP